MEHHKLYLISNKEFSLYFFHENGFKFPKQYIPLFVFYYAHYVYDEERLETPKYLYPKYNHNSSPSHQQLLFQINT